LPFSDFSLLESCKTHKEMMLQPGGRNWQLIYQIVTAVFVNTLLCLASKCFDVQAKGLVLKWFKVQIF
jgi:hypothetical protein